MVRCLDRPIADSLAGMPDRIAAEALAIGRDPVPQGLILNRSDPIKCARDLSYFMSKIQQDLLAA